MAKNKAATLNIFSKKALFMSAFFMLYALLTPPILADSCSSDKLTEPEKVTVKFVYDGDTILLTDKRKIRIIGIDTPETKHHKQKAQRFGARATEALRELLKNHNNRVYLRYGAQRKDRYSRTLAHVFLADGTNISNWLLERGFAKILPIPPNVELANCYRIAEQNAQNESLRIWGLSLNQSKEITELAPKFKGFTRLSAIVSTIKYNKKSSILKLKGNNNKLVQAKIQKKNLRYFEHLNLDDLIDKTIVIAGQIKNRKGKQLIYLNHPSQLTLSQQFIKTHRQSSKSKKGSATIKWSH